MTLYCTLLSSHLNTVQKVILVVDFLFKYRAKPFNWHYTCIYITWYFLLFMHLNFKWLLCQCLYFIHILHCIFDQISLIKHNKINHVPALFAIIVEIFVSQWCIWEALPNFPSRRKHHTNSSLIVHELIFWKFWQCIYADKTTSDVQTLVHSVMNVFVLGFFCCGGQESGWALWPVCSYTATDSCRSWPVLNCSHADPCPSQQ